MAKKKKAEPEEDNGFEDLEDDEVESAYPELGKKASDDLNKVEDAESFALEEEEDIEEFEYELEEEPEIPEYKHLNLILNRGITENDYELQIEGQSHGFCNILVKHLLNIEGVNMAAYKYTRIDPAQIFIRLEPSHKIKDIIYQGIESLREEVIEVQNTFKKLT
jgi:DNA-directed RNA polymerase subunit L